VVLLVLECSLLVLIDLRTIESLTAIAIAVGVVLLPLALLLVYAPHFVQSQFVSTQQAVNQSLLLYPSVLLG
jgi:hypothetical protein